MQALKSILKGIGIAVAAVFGIILHFAISLIGLGLFALVVLYLIYWVGICASS